MNPILQHKVSNTLCQDFMHLTVTLKISDVDNGVLSSSAVSQTSSALAIISY